jgi:hypothetical protein
MFNPARSTKYEKNNSLLKHTDVKEIKVAQKSFHSEIFVTPSYVSHLLFLFAILRAALC